MRNLILVVIVMLVALSGCNIFGPQIDMATVNFSVVADSSGPMMSRAYAQPDDYPEGSISGGLEMSFLAQNVELWSTQRAIDSNEIIAPGEDEYFNDTLTPPNGGFTNDPIYNLYSYSLYYELHQQDPENWPWYWEPGWMGPVSTNIGSAQKYTFSSGNANAVPPVEVVVGSTVYDVVRISVEEIEYTHNDDIVHMIYNEVTKTYQAISEFDSIFLISTEYINSPYFIPNTDFSLTYDELEAKHGEFYASFLTENKGHIIMDGAIFLPFEGIDLTNLNVDDVVVTIAWNIDNSIRAEWFPEGEIAAFDGNRFVYNERVPGTGVPFDFGISANIY